MNRFLPFVGAGLVALSPFVASADDAHVVVGPDKLSWGPAPPSVPKGAQVAVLSGDPGKSGLYALRLKVPAGYKVPAHTHPTDENITVLSGSIHVGMGDKLDQKKGQAVKAGGFFNMPQGMHHYAWFTEATVIQVHGQGPFAIDYINPADDPRKTN